MKNLNDRIESAYQRGILKTGYHKAALVCVANEVDKILCENGVDLNLIDAGSENGVVYRWKTGLVKLFKRD